MYVFVKIAGTLGHLGTLTRYINYQSMSDRAQSASASIPCPLIILQIANVAMR